MASTIHVEKARPIIGCTGYRKSSDGPSSTQVIGVPASYVEAILAGGGIPLLIPIGLSESDLSIVFERLDGLMLPGGGDILPSYYNGKDRHVTLRGLDEARDVLEMSLVRLAIEKQKPMLAICRGHQVFNVALGGSLWQDIYTEMDGAIKHDYNGDYPRNLIPHQVQVKPETTLERLLGSANASVNSIHHQGIRKLAPELTIAAMSPDGIVEAVELTGHPFAVGVQWHPENLIHDDAAMLSLFKGLTAAAAAAAGEA